MASIQKIKTNKGIRYRVSYDLPRNVDGKRRKTTRMLPIGSNFSDAKKFAAAKDLERSKSDFSENCNITFSEYTEHYLKVYTSFLSKSTLRGYRSILYNQKPWGLCNYFGEAKLNSIKTRHVQEFTNELTKRVSAKSCKNYLMLLNVIFGKAVQDGLLRSEDNPMKNHINRPQQQKKEIQAYSLEEVNKILKIADEDKNPDIKLIINLALLSGIRRSEMAGLKWKNVNFEEGYIYICEARIVVEGGVAVEKNPKTVCSTRRIFLPPRLIAILTEYHQRYLENKIQYGRNFADKDYVLSKPNGEPFSPQGISNNYLRFMERHKDEIRYLKFHGLRHTYASLLIEQGENPKTVQHNLGHSDVSLTLQIYSHSYESAQKRAAENLENTIKQIV